MYPATSSELCPCCGGKLRGDGLTIPRHCVNLYKPMDYLTLGKINTCEELLGMNTKTIPYNNTDMVIHFEYEPAQAETFMEPGSPEMVTICNVLIRNVDILDLLSDAYISELESEVLL